MTAGSQDFSEAVMQPNADTRKSVGDKRIKDGVENESRKEELFVESL